MIQIFKILIYNQVICKDKVKTYMVPVSVCSNGQLFPSLHQKNTSIANFARSLFTHSKTFFEFRFILFAICKSRAWRLCFTNATSIHRSINLWLMETKHCLVFTFFPSRTTLQKYENKKCMIMSVKKGNYQNLTIATWHLTF